MQGSLSAPPLAAAPSGLRPLQGPAATAMGAEQRLDAAEGTDAAAETAPDLPPQPPLMPLQPGISRAQQPQSPQSYVLSGSADPPLAQQARWLLFGLACTVIGGFKLARHLSWLQFRCDARLTVHLPSPGLPTTATNPPPSHPSSMLRSWVILVPAIVLAASLAMVSALPDVYRRQRLFLWAHPLIQLVTLIAAVSVCARSGSRFWGAARRSIQPPVWLFATTTPPAPPVGRQPSDRMRMRRWPTKRPTSWGPSTALLYSWSTSSCSAA